MAICSPNAPPNIIRSENPDILYAAYLTDEGQRYLKEFAGGFAAKTLKVLKSDLANMLGTDWEQLERFFVRRGWTTPAGKMASQEFGSYEVAFMALATKVYLESKAGGIQRLADSFMAKIAAGQPALAEGVQLAKEMRGLAKFQGMVSGADQQMGRSLWVQSVITADEQSVMKANRDTLQEMDRLSGVTDADLDKMRSYEDVLTRAGRQLGDPEEFQNGINSLVDLARRIQSAERPQDVVSSAAYVNLPARLFEEIVINGLMSSPQTVSVNALSVTWGVGRQILKYGGAQLLRAASALLGQTGTAGTAAGFLGSPEQYRLVAAEASAGLAAMQSAVSDGLVLAWRAAKNESEFYKRTRGSGVVENRDQSRAITGINVRELAMSNGWAKPEQFSDGLMETFDTIGGFVRLPSRLAMAGDQFTKHLVVRAEIAAQAVRTAVLENVDFDDPVEFKKIMDRELSKAYMYQGDQATQLNAAYEHWSKLTREANRATFQEDNALARDLNNIINKFPPIRPFFPFIRTPLNILRQGFYESTILKPLFEVGESVAQNWSSPTRAVLEIQRRMLEDPAETARISGQIALSTLLVATIYSKVQDGTIVGGGPGRWSKGGFSSPAHLVWEKSMRDSGRVPYSVKVGDASIPFDRFGEPMAIVMRMAADVGMFASYASQTEQDDTMGAFVGLVTSGFYNATFLTGVQDLMEIVNPRNATTFDQRAGTAMQNYVAALTPFGGLLNYLDKAVDPYKHIYGSQGVTKMFSSHEIAMGRHVFGKMMDRIPGVGNTPILVDQLTGLPVPATIGGGPQGLNPLQMAIPFLPRGYNDADSVWKMVYDINANFAEKQPGDGDLDLSLPEQQKVNAEMAKIQLNGMTVAQAIRQFHSRGDVQEYIRNKRGLYSSVRSDIEEEFDGMIREYFKEALDNVVAKDSSMIRRRALALDARARAKSNDVEGAARNLREMVQLMQQSN